MNNEFILVKVNEALVAVLLMSAPILIATVIVGVLLGLIQALTQIQDQALPQALKIILVLVMLIFLGPWMSNQVVRHASAVLDEFPIGTR